MRRVGVDGRVRVRDRDGDGGSVGLGRVDHSNRPKHIFLELFVFRHVTASTFSFLRNGKPDGLYSNQLWTVMPAWNAYRGLRALTGE